MITRFLQPNKKKEREVVVERVKYHDKVTAAGAAAVVESMRTVELSWKFSLQDYSICLEDEMFGV